MLKMLCFYEFNLYPICHLFSVVKNQSNTFMNRRSNDENDHDARAVVLLDGQ